MKSLLVFLTVLATANPDIQKFRSLKPGQKASMCAVSIHLTGDDEKIRDGFLQITREIFKIPNAIPDSFFLKLAAEELAKQGVSTKTIYTISDYCIKSVQNRL